MSVQCEFRTKVTLCEIHLDGLLGKPICISYKIKGDIEEGIGFFGGHNDKYLYLSWEELDKPVAQMGFLEKLLAGIDKIPIEDIIEVVVYTHSTRYRIEN